MCVGGGGVGGGVGGGGGSGVVVVGTYIYSTGYIFTKSRIVNCIRRPAYNSHDISNQIHVYHLQQRGFALKRNQYIKYTYRQRFCSNQLIEHLINI